MTRKLLLSFMALAIGLPLLSRAGEKKQAGQYGFVENKGQVTDQNHLPNNAVKYLLNTNGLNVQLRAGGFSYDAYTVDKTNFSLKQLRNWGAGIPDATIRFHRVDITLEGANTDAAIVAERPADDYLNYYTAAGAFAGVRHYGKVTYQNIYKGIDLEFVTSADKSVEYNFIVHPGADASQIKMHYAGANSISLQDGRISMNLSHGMMQEHIPASYIAKTGEPVTVQYRVAGNNSFGYETGNYDKTKTLVIDPIPDIAWATFYGGSGNDAGMYITVSGSSVYNAGFSASSNAIATTGAYQATLSGINDGFIVKFNREGVRQWATYYGGSANDVVQSVCASAGGDVCITGQTTSTSGIATSGAHQVSHAGGSDPNDGFIAKFSSTGALSWATYYGGAAIEYIVGSTFDNSGNIYACGTTASTTGIATGIGFQTSFAGGTGDGFLVKFNSSGVRQWGTYAGSSSLDEANAVAVDFVGNVALCGTINGAPSTSNLVSGGAHQAVYGGGSFDYFLARYDGNGGRYWSTYYGGSFDESRIEGRRVGVDNSGNIYLVGGTGSNSGIATSGTMMPSYAGGEDGFIAKFNSGGTRLWGTYYGYSGGDDALTGIAMDGTSSDIYVAGFTTSTTGLATTNSYRISSTGGNTDMYFARITNAGFPAYASFFGGTNDEEVHDVAVDATQHMYVCGATNSSASLSTTGSHQPTFGGGAIDGFVARFNACSPTVLVGGTTTVTNVSCFGLNNGSVTVNASGGVAPYKYKLSSASSFGTSNIFSNLAPGNYGFDIIDDHGCENQAIVSAQITQPAQITPSISGTLNTEKGNLENYSTPAQSGVTFTWSATGGTIQSGQGTNQVTVQWNTSGLQTVKLIASSAPCSDSATYSVNVKPPVSVDYILRENGIAVYPNPAGDHIRISLDHTTAAGELITLYNTVGKMVLQQPLQKEQLVNISQLAAGVYSISIGEWHGKVTKL